MDYQNDIRDKLRRWDELDMEFNNGWKQHAMELSTFCMPRQGRFFSSDRNRGIKRHNNILDNTCTNSLRVLAAGLMGGASSPARPWFRLAVPDEDMMKNDNVKRWLSKTTQSMLTVFARSNTYRALHTIYEELSVFGTAAALIMQDFDEVIRIHTFTYGEYRLDKDHRGVVNTFMREFDMTVAQLVEEFGYENCSVTVQQAYNNKRYGTWVTILHVIEPNRSRDPSKKDSINMPYTSCYFEKSGHNGKYLRHGGMRRFRIIAPRWHVTGEDVYGQSPTMEVLGDTKQLQHQQLRKAEAIDYQVRVPLKLPTSLKNRDIDRLPGGATYVDGGQGDVGPLFQVNLNLQHLREDIMDVRERIRSGLYTDMFLMLANDTRSGITATEVAERHEEKLLMLGPVLERLHNENHAQLIDIVFEDMVELGLVDPPPEELQGMPLTVHFVSMLAQAQRAIATNSIDRYVMSLGALVPVVPDIMDNFDADYYADHMADLLGIDPRLVRVDEERDALRQARAQQQMQAQQMAMAEQAATAANKLAASPTDGQNALTDAVNMFSGYGGVGV